MQSVYCRQSEKGIKPTNSYKLFYAGKNNTRNGVEIIVDEDLKEKIAGIKMLGDRIIVIEVVLEEDMIHIITAYAP